MKIKLWVVSLLVVGSLFGSVTTVAVTRLAPLSSDDREFLVQEFRRMANDDSGWLLIELSEVGYGGTMSYAQFERLKGARRQALNDAAYVLETHQPIN